MANIETQQVFKVILLGDIRTGKTSYVQGLTMKFENDYFPTIHNEITAIEQNTSKGYLRLNIWDSPGDIPHGILFDDYLMYSDAALIFYNVNRRNTYYNLARFNSEIMKCCDRIPTVFCANKIDFGKFYVPNKLSSKYLIEPHDMNTCIQMFLLKS